MKIQKLFITMAAALAVVTTSARAEDAPAASQGETMKEAGHMAHSDTVSASAGKGGFTFTGYVDALAGYSTASRTFVGGTRLGNPFLAGSSPSLNLMTTGTRPGCSGAATCRDTDFTFLGGEALLQMKKDFGGKGIAAATLSFAEAGAGNETNSTGYALTVEELYAGINVANNVNFYLGRFIAPIGIESVWSNARKTITMSNLFAGALPFYYTGAMLAYEPSEGAFAKAMIFNDWVGSNIDGGVDKGYSLLVGYTGGGAYVGLTWMGDLATRAAVTPAVVGPRNSDWTNLINLDVTYAKDKLFVGFEGTYRLINTPGNDAQWIGAEVIGSFKATDAVEVGARIEYNYLDPQQAALSAVDPAAVTAGFAGPGSFKGLGLTPFVIYTVTDGLFVRGEYRYDLENPISKDKGGAPYGYSHFLGLNVNATF